ncbi:hypothetical protein PAPYR_11770 [Paratrimastix pyriformis]|uniref:Secreted protein n=1 Tax=Paratrimastix pyriformis TaxID=342808 RepID=A0ABQ8UA68_9EUKA|nr:hypothetical protein PAPYR_11770 [Paratrimastix pyriformis]
MAAMQGYLCPLGVHCWVLFLYHRRYGVSLRGSPQGRRNAVALWVTEPRWACWALQITQQVRTRQKSAEANPATSSGGELPVTHGS